MHDSEEQEIVEAKAWVICPCGEKHRLLPGVGAPVYWCRNSLKSLKEGDDIEYEDTQ